jgi:rubrerythrin
MTENPLRSESLMLETAKDLEMQTMKIHLQNAVSFRDARMAELFRDMARTDEQHFETLESYYGKTKKPPAYPYH